MASDNDFEKELQDFADKVNKALNYLVEPKSLRSLGAKEAEVIKRRTRLGYGVPEDGGPKDKFANLKDSTKLSRKYKGRQGKLSDQTSPNKSNLTSTGKMIDSIVSKVEDRTTVITIEGDRKSIAAYHQAGTSRMRKRRFLGLAAEDIQQIKAFMQDRLNQIIGNLFG